MPFKVTKLSLDKKTPRRNLYYKRMVCIVYTCFESLNSTIKRAPRENAEPMNRQRDRDETNKTKYTESKHLERDMNGTIPTKVALWENGNC